MFLGVWRVRLGQGRLELNRRFDLDALVPRLLPIAAAWPRWQEVALYIVPFFAQRCE